MANCHPRVVESRIVVENIHLTLRAAQTMVHRSASQILFCTAKAPRDRPEKIFPFPQFKQERLWKRSAHLVHFLELLKWKACAATHLLLWQHYCILSMRESLRMKSRYREPVAAAQALLDDVTVTLAHL